jgi:hypothetical protein
MYYQYDFDSFISEHNMNNRLYATFVAFDEINSFIKEITSKYEIMYNKMFILNVKSNDEYVITYNVEQGNVSTIPENTILVHRKKETNTLYTINSLNELIKTLNNGVLDNKFNINWNQYKNCILLTQSGVFKQLNTKIYKIIEL